MRFPALTKLNAIPPKHCRAFAASRGRFLTQRDLVARSGLTKDRVLAISRLDKWDSLRLDEAFNYAAACGFRLDRLRSDLYYRIRRLKFCKHLTASQRKLCARLLT